VQRALEEASQGARASEARRLAQMSFYFFIESHVSVLRTSGATGLPFYRRVSPTGLGASKTGFIAIYDIRRNVKGP